MKLICTQCGNVGEPKLHTKGSIFLELFLWFCLLLPGLIYSIWRHMSRSYVCRFCGAKEIIPLHSPIGKRLLEKMSEP